MERFELEPDRSLLDAHFESYKLSLESCAVFPGSAEEFPSHPILARAPNEEQFSFQHSKLFGGTNLLVQDPFHSGRVFLLDPPGQRIFQVEVDPEGVTRAPGVIEVWRFPSGSEPPQGGDYNPSLVFASPDLALVADGSGMVFFLSTPERGRGSQGWKSVFHDQISGPHWPFVLVSARKSVIPDPDGSKADEEAQATVQCLLLAVEARAKVVEEAGQSEALIPAPLNFVNVVKWLTFGCTGQCWGLDRVRQWAFTGSIDYLQLDQAGERLLCSTDKPFHLLSDSAGSLAASEVEGTAPGEMDNGPLPAFYWFQGVEDMVVWVVLPEDATKRDIKVTFKPREMRVLFRGETLFGGALWHILDGDSMTWTIQKGKLEINVSKAAEGRVWQRFLEVSLDDGEEIGQPAMIDAIVEGVQARAKAGPPVPSLNADQLEECDALPEDESSLHVVHGNQVVGQASLSGHQHLLNVAIGNGPQALCLRHDVDGLVWQAESLPDSTRMTFKHIGTFPALGYVQASKEMRKFSTAPPDLSYVALVDRSRHIYIYRQPAAIAAECDLRNRKSGQKVSQIAKQQVITLESNDDIVGAQATPNSLLVLTSTSLYGIRI